MRFTETNPLLYCLSSNEFSFFGPLGPIDGLVDFLSAIRTLDLHLQILGPIHAFSNLMLIIHILNLMSSIHILNMMLRILFYLLKSKASSRFQTKVVSLNSSCFKGL